MSKEKIKRKMETKRIKLDKNTTFGDLLEKHPECVEILMGVGMHCIGCPASNFETIEQGAMMHGINPDELIKKINNKT